MPGLGNPILRETGSPLLSVSGGSEGMGQGRWAGAGHRGNWTTLTFRVRADPDPEPELAAGSGPFPQSRDHTEAQRVAAVAPVSPSPPARSPARKRVVQPVLVPRLLSGWSLAPRFLRGT